MDIVKMLAAYVEAVEMPLSGLSLPFAESHMRGIPNQISLLLDLLTYRKQTCKEDGDNACFAGFACIIVSPHTR